MKYANIAQEPVSRDRDDNQKKSSDWYRLAHPSSGSSSRLDLSPCSAFTMADNKLTVKQKFTNFCSFLYNSETGEVLGRSGRNWGKCIFASPLYHRKQERSAPPCMFGRLLFRHHITTEISNAIRVFKLGSFAYSSIINSVGYVVIFLGNGHPQWCIDLDVTCKRNFPWAHNLSASFVTTCNELLSSKILCRNNSYH